MLAHGSDTSSGISFCSISIEILSGDLIKAMYPSLGGLFIVIPF